MPTVKASEITAKIEGTPILANGAAGAIEGDRTTFTDATAEVFAEVEPGDLLRMVLFPAEARILLAPDDNTLILSNTIHQDDLVGLAYTIHRNGLMISEILSLNPAADGGAQWALFGRGVTNNPA